MTIKIDCTEITVPEFITSELIKERNRKLFDNFIRTILTAQGQRIRKALTAEYGKDKKVQGMFERLLKGMGGFNDTPDRKN
jgi:hypothetical protein